MSLLDQAIEKKVLRAVGKKLAIQLDPKGLDTQLMKLVGKYLGTSTAGPTVKEAFLFAASRAINPTAGLIAGVQFDHAERLLEVIGAYDAAVAKGHSSSKLLKVMVLRWAVLAISGRVQASKSEVTTPEQLVNCVLAICKADLDTLFRAGGN